MTCPTSYFSLNFKNFELELKSRNSHHDLSDFIIFPKFLKILNLNPKVGTAIMTCPTSYFSLNSLQKFEFESKSRNSHHDLSDFIFFPKFLKNLNLNPKVGTAIMTCPTSYFFPKFLKILNLNQKVGTAIMTCPTPYFPKIKKKN